jgi:hypothetical protein
MGTRTAAVRAPLARGLQRRDDGRAGGRTGHRPRDRWRSCWEPPSARRTPAPRSRQRGCRDRGRTHRSPGAARAPIAATTPMTGAQSGTSDSAASPVQAAGFSGPPADDPAAGPGAKARGSRSATPAKRAARVRTATSAVAPTTTAAAIAAGYRKTSPKRYRSALLSAELLGVPRAEDVRRRRHEHQRGGDYTAALGDRAQMAGTSLRAAQHGLQVSREPDEDDGGEQ